MYLENSISYLENNFGMKLNEICKNDKLCIKLMEESLLGCEVSRFLQKNKQKMITFLMILQKNKHNNYEGAVSCPHNLRYSGVFTNSNISRDIFFFLQNLPKEGLYVIKINNISSFLMTTNTYRYLENHNINLLENIPLEKEGYGISFIPQALTSSNTGSLKYHIKKQGYIIYSIDKNNILHKIKTIISEELTNL